MAKFSVGTDIVNTLKNWAQLLRALTFTDNFRAFEWVGSLEAGKELNITHNLTVTPTRFIVLGDYPALIRKGAGSATAQFFPLKNIGTTSKFTGKVLILP